MDVRIISELKPYSHRELNKFLSDTAISKLLFLNMLRKLTKRDFLEIEDLLHDNAKKLLNLTEGQIYVFRFVGIVTVENTCLISYPKYISQVHQDNFDNNKEIIKEIIEVIRKYESLEQFQDLNSEVSTDEDFNLLAFTLDLLEDYYRYGLYSNSEEIIELNGNGDILWDKTIAEQTMFLSGKDPIYLDYHTANNDVNYNDFVRNLHATVLTLCTKELEDVLGILDIDMLNLSSNSIEDFGDTDYITYKLHQEYIRQFVTHKQRTINKLIEYINSTNAAHKDSNLSFVGTTAFNLIWEKVCAIVLNDCRNKTMVELGLVSPFDNIPATSTIMGLIPYPKWQHNASKVVHEVKSTLEPDIVVVEKDGISIYDAKYYNIYFTEKGIRKQPGIGDISKQYLYEKVYLPLAEKNNLPIRINAFVMPSGVPIDSSEPLGSVSLDLFGNDNLHNIDIILKYARDMYQKYLQK